MRGMILVISKLKREAGQVSDKVRPLGKGAGGEKLVERLHGSDDAERHADTGTSRVPKALRSFEDYEISKS
jgi:hypothetical protein